MKVSLLDALRNGIRPDDRLPRNTAYLQQCRNVSAGPFAIRPMRDIVQPITDAALSTAVITKSHPFPQLFRMREGTLLMDRAGVYGVSVDPTSNWGITGGTPKDFTTYSWESDSASNFTIPANGGDWHLADMGAFFMLFNGNCTIFTVGFAEGIFGQDDVSIETGGVHNDGRLFLGGFDDADVYDLADWPSYLATLSGEFRGDAERLYADGLAQNWVWWSSIGAPDALHFFSLDYMKFMSLAASPATGFNEANPFWRTLAQRRESFAAPMPTPGKVLRILQLGEGMVVYTETGVYSLQPVVTNEVSTYGVFEVGGFGKNIGVQRGSIVRASAGGTEQVQAMIDEANDLWILTPGIGGVKAEYRGYRHLFAQSSNWAVSYDPSEREFHFSAGPLSYRLGESGNMSLNPHGPTTVFFGRSNNVSAPVGIRINNSVSINTATIITDWFDAGPDVKSPQLVRLWLDTGETNAFDWSVNVTAKMVENGTNTVSSGNLRPDARGLVQVDLSGSAFRVSLIHLDRTVAVLQNLEAEFDNGERRKIARWLT